jgi:hypothetical protein
MRFASKFLCNFTDCEEFFWVPRDMEHLVECCPYCGGEDIEKIQSDDRIETP